jgi:hypothetical protein
MLNETRNGQTRRWLVSSGIAGVSLAATVAWAADSTPVQNGIMTFPNVKVVSVPSLPANAPAEQVPEPRGGFKAYVDPATGHLVKPSAEAKEALATAARARAAQSERRRVQPPVTFTSPYGGIGHRRDESHASFLVARRNADGTHGMACIPAEHAAEWLSKEPAVKGDPK